MAIDGISVVTDGLKYGSGSFAERLTSHGLVGSYGSSVLTSMIYTARRLLLLFKRRH